jgi:hypothetical protein
VAARRGSLARNPLQISETVSDPVSYLVRHGRSPDYGRGSTPAATAKDIERAGVCTHRYGYPHRDTERNSGAEQHFCDHQMPSHWSRCMLRQRTGSGPAMESVPHALIVALRRGVVAHASAQPRYLLPATRGRYPLRAGLHGTGLTELTAGSQLLRGHL